MCTVFVIIEITTRIRSCFSLSFLWILYLEFADFLEPVCWVIDNLCMYISSWLVVLIHPLCVSVGSGIDMELIQYCHWTVPLCCFITNALVIHSVASVCLCGVSINHAPATPAHRPHTGPTSIKHAPAVPAEPRLNHASAHRPPRRQDWAPDRTERPNVKN